MNDEKYFVVSLPRSGTTSICKMAKICALKPKHAPHVSFKKYLKRDEFNFFSDTPVFCPDEINEICFNEEINSKFIYIDRNFNDIFESWKNVKLYSNYLGMINEKIDNLKPSTKFDLCSYNNAFNNIFLNENTYNDIFEKHKKQVIDTIKKYKKNLLIYKFEEGWKPFCDFLNVEIPCDDIPTLNKNKMFDNI